MKLLDKIKKSNFKTIIKSFTLLWGVVLIVFMTLANIGLKQGFDIVAWLGDTLILFGIMVFGLFMGESLGDDAQRQKVGGLFQTALKDYNDKRKEIDKDVIYFSQFYEWLIPQELEAKKVEYLIANNVNKDKAFAIVRHCTLDDFAPLCEHPLKIDTENGKSIVIRKLTLGEQESVLKVLKGEIKLNLSGSAYYLTAFGRANTKRIVEMGKQIDKEIKFNKTSNRLVKIITSLAISLVMAMFTINDFVSGDSAVAWVNLVSRITMLFTSMFAGWLSSVIDVKLKARKIINKTDVLSLFQSSLAEKIFIPKNESELAQQELEQYEKEQQEAIANVVEPEIVLLETTTNLLDNCDE